MATEPPALHSRPWAQDTSPAAQEGPAWPRDLRGPSAHLWPSSPGAEDGSAPAQAIGVPEPRLLTCPRAQPSTRRRAEPAQAQPHELRPHPGPRGAAGPGGASGTVRPEEPQAQDEGRSHCGLLSLLPGTGRSALHPQRTAPGTPNLQGPREPRVRPDPHSLPAFVAGVPSGFRRPAHFLNGGGSPSPRAGPLPGSPPRCLPPS